MASSFWNGDFYFDGDSSSKYRVCLIDFNNNDIVKQIGGSHAISIDKETSYNGQHFYKETERTSDNIVLQLAKTDRKAWTIAEISDINDWLFKENFCKFQPTDFSNQGYNIVYYLKAIDMKKFLTPSLEGYLEITFQSYDGYAYVIPNFKYSNTTSNQISIYNMSNKKYLPKIKILNHEDKDSEIKINNLTNGDILTLKGIQPYNEKATEEEKKEATIIIDCAIGSVINLNNKNCFSILQDYNFISLERENNTIQVIGNATVEFICEFPIII